MTTTRRTTPLALFASLAILTIAGCGGGGGSDEDTNTGGGGGGGSVEPGRYIANYTGPAAVLGDTVLSAVVTVASDGSVSGRLVAAADGSTRGTFTGSIQSAGVFQLRFTDGFGAPGGSFDATGTTTADPNTGYANTDFESPRGEFRFGNITKS